ncbi:MAG: YlxR family protein [Mycoplasma sp.]|nr:YlxR family protein [Mycoplasma sp.]
MKVKTNKIRTCIVTNNKKLKQDLIRIVKTKENFITVSNTLLGRGLYVEKNLNNYKIIKDKKLLHKKFKIPIENKVYDEVIKQIEEINEKA